MEEDMRRICELLHQTLRATRDQHDLLRIDYDEESEIATLVYPGGTKPVNVALDSGVAMIRDIMRALY